MGKQYIRVKRGMVFWLDQKIYEGDERYYTGHNGKEYRSHIQMGRRPYLVVSNDQVNSYSPTCNIVPITTADAKADIPVHVKFIFERETQYILCEQPRTVDIMALGKYHCTLSDEIMEEVDQALAIQFDIRPEIRLAELTLSNTVKTLESLVDKILQSKMKQMERNVSVSEVEDAAIRFSEMVEDLIIDPRLTPVTTTNEKNLENALLTPVKKQEDALTNCHANDNPYKGLSVEKFNQKYKNYSNAKSDTSKQEHTSSSTVQKKKRNSWTIDKRKAYLHDCDVMAPQEIMKKYGFSSIQSVFQTKYACKNALKVSR